MSVCPFCKAPVRQSTAPCPACGKLAADHPSIASISGRTLSTDFDDDEPGDLSLEAGSGLGGHASHGAMPYESGKGVTLDDDLFGDGEAGGPLELDVPNRPAPPAPPAPAPASEPRIAAPAPPQSSGRWNAAPPAPDSAPAPVAPPPPPSAHDAAAIRIANYPPVPAKVWEAPRYAVRVLVRRLELRQDLEALRRRRSPDVALYERAMVAHDARMFMLGLAITGAAVFVATVLFFMPVIKRFAFAPD